MHSKGSNPRDPTVKLNHIFDENIGPCNNLWAWGAILVLKHARAPGIKLQGNLESDQNWWCQLSHLVYAYVEESKFSCNICRYECSLSVSIKVKSCYITYTLDWLCPLDDMCRLPSTSTRSQVVEFAWWRHQLVLSYQCIICVHAFTINALNIYFWNNSYPCTSWLLNCLWVFRFVAKGFRQANVAMGCGYSSFRFRLNWQFLQSHKYHNLLSTVTWLVFSTYNLTI